MLEIQNEDHSIIPDYIEQYDTFDIQNAYSMKVESKLVIEPPGIRLLLYPAPKNIADIQVEDSNGKNLLFLSDAQIDSQNQLMKIRNSWESKNEREGTFPLFIVLDDNKEQKNETINSLQESILKDVLNLFQKNDSNSNPLRTVLTVPINDIIKIKWVEPLDMSFKKLEEIKRIRMQINEIDKGILLLNNQITRKKEEVEYQEQNTRKIEDKLGPQFKILGRKRNDPSLIESNRKSDELREQLQNLTDRVNDEKKKKRNLEEENSNLEKERKEILKGYSGGLWFNKKIIFRQEFFYSSNYEETYRYIEIKTNEKYEIQDFQLYNKEDKPIITEIDTDLDKNNLHKYKYEQILSTKHNLTIGFPPKDRPSIIKLTCQIGIPTLVMQWVIFGAILGLIMPSSILLMSFFYPSYILNNIDKILSLLAGIIALVLGLRLLIFYDIELMKGWSRFYIFIVIFGLLVSSILLLLYIFTGSSPALIIESSTKCIDTFFIIK